MIDPKQQLALASRIPVSRTIADMAGRTIETRVGEAKRQIHRQIGDFKLFMV